MKKCLYVVSIFIISLLAITSVYGTNQSRWVSLTSDSTSAVQKIVESEVGGYSTPEQAALNLKDAQKEKDEKDAAYNSDVRSATNDYNRAKKRRDELMAQFQTTSQEKEVLQKTIQDLKKGVENCENSIARFEEDIQSQQRTLGTWLKSEKQGEAVVAVIYTRGFKDVAQQLERLADQASAPLLAEHMGTKIQAYSTVINNVLAKDVIKATVEGTAKPVNEEPLKLELDTSPAGSIYLRLKRYELFPFQSPTSGHVKPGKDAEKFKVQVTTSESDLEEFLRKNGYPRPKTDLARFRQMIDETRENNRASDDSLNSTISTNQSRINQYKEKIEEQRKDKGRNEGKLSRDLGTYKKQEREVALIEANKNNAEREFQQAQTNLQQKKRTRETIIIKDARAVVKGSESPANAVASAISDKLKEVKNDARTQHSTATTTVVNYQVASEDAGQAVTDASILGIRLISFLNEGENGVRVQMAFRVRTMLADDKAASPAKKDLVKTNVVVATQKSIYGTTVIEISDESLKIEHKSYGTMEFVLDKVVNNIIVNDIVNINYIEKDGKLIAYGVTKTGDGAKKKAKKKATTVADIVARPSVSTANEGSEIRRDDRFIAYSNGTVVDTRTNLMWAAKDSGSNINWQGAKYYCENYRGGGYSDWRMPTLDELAGLHDTGKSRPVACNTSYQIHVATELIDITCLLTWTSETRGSDAATFSFNRGTRNWTRQSNGNFRALPVRSGNSVGTEPIPEVKSNLNYDKANSLSGEWVNGDPNTRGYTRLIIRSEDNMVFIHFYGACHPTECDAGEAQCSAAEANRGSFTLTKKSSFKNEKYDVKLFDDGTLSVKSYVVFTDNSGRKPYNMINIFKKTEVVAVKKAVKKAKKAKKAKDIVN